MKRYFVFQDGNSQKFWSIEVNGSNFSVTFGKLGTTGQKSEKSFDSEEKCKKEAEKLIAEKTKKGYTESSEKDVGEAKNEGKKYYFKEDYEGDINELAEQILSDKRLSELKYISIGAWGESFEQGPNVIVDMMIKNKEKFQHIESLFFGDMEAEECEISWINQCSYEELLKALPKLKILKIKGSEGLSLGKKLVHSSLEELQIMCGGLPAGIVQELKNASLPNLKKLILYMGVEGYGLTCSVKDMAALASKSLFPKLKELGFVNSQEEDAIVEMLLSSNILAQLEVLDLSYGCLSDKGGQLILDAKDKLTSLKTLKIEYHYMSKEMVKKLKALPLTVNVSNAQEAEDEDDMYPMFTE